MNKFYIDAPSGIRYISEWEGFTLPQEHCIINKVVCGCGFTEACLRNKLPVILCSPRKVLLENKYEQHQGDNMYLVVNESEKYLLVDIETTGKKGGITKKDLVEPKEDMTKILGLIEDIKMYVLSSGMGTVYTPKILVTYDSFKHVWKALQELGQGYIDSFWVVVDEFQSVFMDASFKATVELDFMEFLSPFRSVIFLSATPMIEKYLDQMPDFSGLPYYELRWQPGMITKPIITRLKTSSINESIVGVINRYKSGNFPQKITPSDGACHLSTEVVFYVNSVTAICQAIKKSGLRPEEVNIICSKTPGNLDKLKKIGMTLGKVPLPGESRKMFTFCTRTVYLGADFYSPCASTIIASDADIKSLALDIALDLPQIMGRQRLSSNVFRDEATIFYKPIKELENKEAFDSMIGEKKFVTDTRINTFKSYDRITANHVLSDRRTLIAINNYKNDYIGISEKTGGLVFNRLAYLSEIRAWEVSQVNYRDDISILGCLDEVSVGSVMSDEARHFLDVFHSIPDFLGAYKFLCEFKFSSPSSLEDALLRVPGDYRNYYYLVGPERSKSLSYKKGLVEAEYKMILSNRSNNSFSDQDKMTAEIKSAFIPGTRYLTSYVKKTLQEIYDKNGYPRKAKGRDLTDFGVTFKNCLIPINGKRESGVEIL
jgi:hypothetical protein